MELLDPVEVRVLGSLIEKEATTPEYYPLSLNALVNACNQKSNRDPVVDYEADTVENAIERLRHKGFAFIITGNGRVVKYSQRISETLNLGRRELGVLCTLLLRGPQTLGEIKDRSERMFSFVDLSETESVLQKLGDWQGHELVRKLPRLAGQKEPRYAHLLAGEPSAEVSPPPTATTATGTVAQLQQELTELRSEFEDVRRRLERLESLLT
jgi:uncharacterized protein YceH (UPF0502 family)